METHGGCRECSINASRPPTDKVELAGTTSPGLVKHHCGFPQCPRYLCDLRSDKDLAAGADALPRIATLMFWPRGLLPPPVPVVPAFHQWPDKYWGSKR